MKTDFTIRIRFRIPKGDRIGLDVNEAKYPLSLSAEVVLKAAKKNQTIRDSDWLILTSDSWASEAEAESASVSLMDALRITLARLGMSADFGVRAPHSFMYRAGLEMVKNLTGRPTLNDTHGTMIFPTDIVPVFAKVGTPSLCLTMQPERWEKAFLFSLDSGHALSEQERTAFDLYNGAHSVRESQDARFVLLFCALEALLEESPRPEPVIRHVDNLITTTSSADLPDEEKDSLLGSLRWLRFYSIRRAGREFVRTRLGNREYGKQPAEDFFLNCYELRNRLLHGRQPFPTRQEVGTLAAPLEIMIGHLISGPALALDV